MSADPVPVGMKTEMVLKKFDGDVSEGTDDPEAAGFKLLEEITIVYENDEKVSESRKVFDGSN
jgi:hypothetical protein